ncbi:hypothetical protein [Streptomyces sp. NPDC002490]|uniref:hypothetical protein n=1 Tax=Streptomyces sp. NPDC002490 TaxID=3154416 RepID=UPI003320D1E1
MADLPLPDRSPHDLEGGLAALRGDCARMAPHWQPEPRSAPPPARALTGVVVPPSAARLLDAMFAAGFPRHGG